jgi:hypothetical protein
MGYLIVLAVSLLVGGAVYAVTMRAGRAQPAAVGFHGPSTADEDEAEAGGPGAGYAYLRVAVRGPSWRDRITGLVGLLVLIAVATVVLAFGIYQLGHLVNVTIDRFLH